MARSSVSKCSRCDCAISSRKQFWLCLVCEVPLHCACSGVFFPRGGSNTWKEFSSNYRCAKCVESLIRRAGADDESNYLDIPATTSFSDVESSRGADGSDEARGEAVKNVAGGSRDGNDVEAIAVRTSMRPKRTIKCREILDPSHVAKRRADPTDGPNLPFYKMTKVLEQLCQDVKLTQKLLSHDKIKAHRKKETQLKNSILFTFWSRFQDNEITTMELLEEIILELRSSFPTVVPGHPLNVNDERIDIYDVSINENDDEM